MTIKLGNHDLNTIYLGSKQVLKLYRGSTFLWGFNGGSTPPSSQLIDKLTMKDSDIITAGEGMYYAVYDMDSTYFKENFPWSPEGYLYGVIFFECKDLMTIGYFLEVEEGMYMAQGEFEGNDGYFYTFTMMLDFEVDLTSPDLFVPSPGKMLILTTINDFDPITFYPITAPIFPIYHTLIDNVSQWTGIYNFTKQQIDFDIYKSHSTDSMAIAYARVDEEVIPGFWMKQEMEDVVTGNMFEYEAVSFAYNGEQITIANDVHVNIDLELGMMEATYGPGETLILSEATYTKFELIPASEHPSIIDVESPESTYSLRKPLPSITNILEELLK